MAVESAADRAGFLNADEFGVQATYTPAGGDGVSVTGIFDAAQISLQFENVPVSDAQPTFLCASEDLPDAAAGGDAGDTLAISAGGSYRVIDLRPDGTGMTLVT